MRYVVKSSLSRRKILALAAGGTGVVGAASFLGTSGAPSERSEPAHEPRACPEVDQADRTDTHVIERGTRRGENTFSYFLDHASLGLDSDQPDEVYSSIYVKLDSEWQQPTERDTCRIYWAGCNLSSGVAGQGGNRPTGDDGWSVRVYTRGPLTDGEVAFGSYVYHLDQSRRFGDLWRWPGTAEVGTWNKIDAHVKLNSVSEDGANSDGVVRTWLNDKLQTSRDDVRWRTTERLGFDRLGPGTYWGGPDGAPRTSIVYYDRFMYIPIGSSPGEPVTERAPARSVPLITELDKRIGDIERTDT